MRAATPNGDTDPTQRRAGGGGISEFRHYWMAPWLATFVLLMVAAAGGAGTVAGRYVATAPTLADGQTKTFRLDAGGALIVTADGRTRWREFDGSEHEIKTANGDDTASGEQLMVAAVASNKIVVLGWIISTDTATKVNFVTDPAGTPSAISHEVHLAANGGWTSDFLFPWFETASGEALGFDVNDTANTGWSVIYYEDDD
jgi:hypothetical protein